MQKLSLLLIVMLVGWMTACSNNQNAVEGETTAEGVVDSAQAKVQQMQEPRNSETNTAGQRPEVKRSSMRLEDKSDNVFSGDFAYMADAAYFINCSTGNRYSVVMEGAFIDLEKAYLKLVGEDAGKPVYIVVEGELRPNSGKEEGRMKGSLKVTKVIGLTDEVSCASVISKLGGMYTSSLGIGTFTNCKGNEIYAVQSSGAFAALNKAYLEAVSVEGKSIYVELYGFRKPIKAETDGSPQTGLVVTRVIGFDKSFSCE